MLLTRSILIIGAASLLCGCSMHQNPPGHDASSASAETFLMFQDGRAAEALRFYADTFPRASIESMVPYASATGDPPGPLFRGVIEIDGHRIAATDSPIEHDFGFTPSVSVFVTCASLEECRRVFEGLSRDGGVLMPLGDYGFSELFGWAVDPYGVSWQISFGTIRVPAGDTPEP